MVALLEDLRSAIRGLRLRPGYALVVIATLALGIGAACAVFSLVDGVVLRPLPYPDANELVLLREKNANNEWNTSVADFEGVRGGNRSFDSVGAAQTYDVVLTGAGEPSWVAARFVTADYFGVLRVAPVRGRGFQRGDDARGAARVVVVGQGFAERRFGAGADPLGRTLELDGESYTVIGVMPAGMESLPAMRAEIWPALQLPEATRRGPFTLSTIARLRDGVTREQAADDLAGVSRSLLARWSSDFKDDTARIVPLPLHEAVVGNVRGTLMLAFGAVIVVLLIAIVNIANLVLMRVTERGQDLGVRAALGASRGRLARLLVTESVLLSLIGGAAGVLLAKLLLQGYRALGPAVPRLAEISVDWRVIAFGAVAGLVSGLAVGVLPLLFGAVGRAGASGARGASASRGQQRLRDGLVSLEFALALPLLVCAGLLVNSLMRVQHVDPGFASEGMLTARVRLPETVYPENTDRIAFWERALAGIQAIPGVRAATLANGTPPDAPGTSNNFDIVGRPVADQPVSPWTPVVANFFDAMGLRVVDGRVFDATDTPDSPPTIVVSESWAKHYFPGERAVGRKLIEGGNVENPVTIVGVVSDVKWDGLRNAGDAVYAPISQGWFNNPLYVFIRTEGDPLALAAPLRNTLLRLEPGAVPSEVTTMASRLRDSTSDARHWATVIAGFALAALLLAAVGVSGVLAYYVSRQRREIGIRLSLGADGRAIVAMVLKRGVVLAAIGSAVGVALSLMLTRSIESLLFEVSRTDVLTLACATALMLAIAFAACWLPARRAARTSPIEALRYE